MSVLVESLVGLGAAVSLSTTGYIAGRRRQQIRAQETGKTTGEMPPVSTPSVARVEDDVTPARSTSVSDALPAETRRVLELLNTGWLLVDPSDKVVERSRAIDALNLVKDVDLRHSQLRDLVREARRRGTALDTHLDLPRGPIDAARVDLHVRIGMLTDELVLVLIEDQTQARRIEETRRDFVVNVSHELKTPVGGLRLLAEAVEDAADDSEAVARFAARMKTETVRLANLVQEIVDLSRLQGADAIATAKPVDINSCASRALDELHLIADDRNIDLQLTDDGKDHTVMGDAGLLTTAIRNLVSNALNYSEPHTRIIVAVSRDDDDVLVEVADQGIGMSADELQRVFERFYRVDPARSRRTGGTGLGLAIVKHVCANHGGEVRVWSEPGVGSTFVLQFPAKVGDAPAYTKPASVVSTIESKENS